MLRASRLPAEHSASGFALALAATRELPEAGPVLLPLATSGGMDPGSAMPTPFHRAEDREPR
jgi:hypothetical protein